MCVKFDIGRETKQAIPCLLKCLPSPSMNQIRMTHLGDDLKVVIV